MSGVLYRRKQYGPLADVFLALIDELYESGKISIDRLDFAEMIRPSSSRAYISESGSTEPTEQKSEKAFIFSTSRIGDYNLLSFREREQIDKICNFWKTRRTAEIVNFTHEQKPWMLCRDGEIIPYELILQEDPDHVYAPIA